MRPFSRVAVLACAAAGVLQAAPALAQARPMTPLLTCQAASGMVAARGALVLGTGVHTYDRYVRDAGACLAGQTTRPAWVPTRDTPQCFVGFTCVDPERFNDSW